MGRAGIVKELGIFTQDCRWLSSNLESLRPKYENKYVLVQNKKVAMADANFDKLLSKASKQKIDISKAVIELILPKNISLM